MYMENNLDNMILASGMTKTRVAEEKGITPQNLSRVIHGKTKLSLTDADEYSKILNCSAQQVMFRNEPVPIALYVHYDINMKPTYDFIADRPDDSPFKDEFPTGEVYLFGPHPFNVAAVLFKVHPDYRGHWIEYSGAMSVIHLDPITENRISKDAFQKSSYVKDTDGKIMYGHVYPEPGSSHTVYNPWRSDLISEDEEITRGVKLAWATPVVATFWQPELRGISTVFDK